MRWSGSSDKALLRKLDANSLPHVLIGYSNRKYSTLLSGLSKSFIPATMTFAETIAKEIIHNMSKQERERFVSLMLDEFFQTMTIDERKEILIKFVPDIVGRALEGMSLRDRKIVVEAALHVISRPEHQRKENDSGIG
jgi:hypothetical protein